MLAGDRFGTKRPRVRIPPLRPGENPGSFKASGVLFVCSAVAVFVEIMGKTGGKPGEQKAGSLTDQREQAGGIG